MGVGRNANWEVIPMRETAEKRGVRKPADAREAPELTGREAGMGRHDRLREVSTVPRYLGWLALFGPGAVFAAMAQGSGELIWWPYLMAKYGAAFVGIILPACALQYMVNVEIGRYSATTGETMFTGFCRVHKAFAGLMWVMVLITYLWFGGYASAGSTALAALTGIPTGWSPRAQTLFWSYLVIAVFGSAILFGRVVYRVIEKIMIAVTVVTVVGLLAAAFHPQVVQHWGEFFGWYFTFRSYWPANWDPKDLDIFLTCICFAGAGGFFNIMYSYWLRDKGIGLGRFVGRVTSPITGQPEAIPATGYVFADTPENRANYRGWIRFVYGDAAFGTGVNAFTLMLTCLLAFALLYPKGLVPSGWKIAVYQAEFFRTSWGYLGQAVFYLVAAAFMADSWLLCVDAISRMHADYFVSNFRLFREWGVRNTYYLWVAILTVISCVTLLLAQPGTLLIVTGVLNFIAMAIYLPALIYLNYYLVPRTFPNWTRPSNVALFFICLSEAVYLPLAIYYLILKF